MHFTRQTIVATFALLNICAYASPMKDITMVNRAPAGIPVTRQIIVEPSYCAGYTEDGCAGYCSDHGYTGHTCTYKYGDPLNTKTSFN